MTEAADVLREAPLISASRLLAERGFYGIVWADTKLQVTARYGELVAFVEIGEPLTSSLLPLLGLESDLRSLRRKPHTLVDVPSVTIVSASGRTPRLNLAVVWSQDESSYLVLASRAVLRSDLEVELNRQIRARLIAEADVSAKSVLLQRANDELARTNTDLEQFASVISHDLKSPMRAMRFLIDDAERLTRAGDVKASGSVLTAIREQSLRISQMLSALLDYASAGRKADVLERVDTRELIDTVISRLSRPDGMAVEVRGSWPELTTLAAPLDLVLRNLIDNAISHHDRDRGLVVIDAADAGADVVFTVSDDGPGIMNEHQSVIFLPFRTLDAARESSGMGLALVARAVNSVGGHIHVISNKSLKRGATFQVRWPKSFAA